MTNTTRAHTDKFKRSHPGDHTATNLARRHEPPTKSQAHHLERLVEENTMDSGIMARLEVEDPLLACHDQTAGWLNRVWVEFGK